MNSQMLKWNQWIKLKGAGSGVNQPNISSIDVCWCKGKHAVEFKRYGNFTRYPFLFFLSICSSYSVVKNLKSASPLTLCSLQNGACVTCSDILMLRINIYILKLWLTHVKTTCVIRRLSTIPRFCQHLEVCMRSPAYKSHFAN